MKVLWILLASCVLLPAPLIAVDDPQISEAQFNQFIDAVIDIHEPEIEAWGDTKNRFINRYWRSKKTGASAYRRGSEGNSSLYLTVYGHTVRHELSTPGSFALILCHEMGHLYGGPPYLDEKNRLSAEGVADYYAVNKCLPLMKDRFPDLLRASEEPSSLITEICNSDPSCQFQIEAALAAARLTADTLGKLAPSLDTPDLSEVDETELWYPETVQCRLDNYVAAAFDLSYPRCWYKY